MFLILKSMLTGYLERDHLMGLCWHTFKNYADRLFRKRSSHGPMLAYLMLHLQVGIRTQTRTEIAILSEIRGIPPLWKVVNIEALRFKSCYNYSSCI